MIRYPDPDLLIDINRHFSSKGIRDIKVVAAAAFEPRQEKYRTLEDKAAVLLSALSQSRAFHDGNKRTALIATEDFLNANGKQLDAPTEQLTPFLMEVATGRQSLRTIAARIEQWSIPLAVAKTHEYWVER